MIIPRASLKRSPRTRVRKNTSVDLDVACPSPLSSVLVRPNRPPPLQITPELLETLSIDAAQSPATARPMHFVTEESEPVSSRVTLSAYTFSIDDALLMFGNDAPGSPALSASSSTTGASSEDVPATPGASDDDDGFDFALPTPRFRPQRISIRPLCITKTRSLISHEDEDIQSYFEREGAIVSLPVTEGLPERSTEAAEETVQDFYTREFEGFISLSPTIPSPTAPARRDSLVLVAESLPVFVEVPRPKLCGRSRHSKPLPQLPPPTPPLNTFPSIPNAPWVRITGQKSVVRRKRNITSLHNHPSPSPPAATRPLPRMDVPLDIEDCVFLEGVLDISSRGSIVGEQAYDIENAGIYSQPSYTSGHPFSAIPETPILGMYGEATLPRSSTDSDAPRSSTDSTLSFASSTSLNSPSSSFLFPSSPTEERLRSRWSSSTLGSLALEPPRSTTLLSPLRSVLVSRARRILPPPPKLPSPSKLPKIKHGFSMTPPPQSTSGKHIRQGSRSSTSSTETSSSERDSHDGSPSGRKRKHIPVAMFLRST